MEGVSILREVLQGNGGRLERNTVKYIQVHVNVFLTWVLRAAEG